MRKYPKYKETEVIWVKSLPDSWEELRVKYFSIFRNGYSFKGTDFFDDEKYPVIRIGDIQDGKVNLSEAKKVSKNIYEEAKKFSNKRGDILLALTGATIGKSAIYDTDEISLLNQRVAALRPNKKANIDFLKYLIEAPEFKTLIDFECYGGAQENIGKGQITSAKFPIPSLPEQNAIVRFLDYKTGQIDSFIANRQKQIELLKEQKAGIIKKAITKGINPNAKMKDCGIEWIGDVPEHWEIWKIKHTSYVKGRIGWDGLRSDEFFENEYAFLVTGTDFIDGKVNWKTCYQITKERYLQDKHIQLKEDDLLITKDGTIGKTAVVKGLVGFASLNSGVFVVRPLRKYISDYLYFILNSNVFTQFINITTTGTTILHLYQNIFEIFEYTVPPIEEQQAIVHYINEESKIIDSLISKYQKQIDLMQEYRTSLISQAVTGKIDVREWEPKKQQTI